jgi:hypothetical protein
MADQTITEDISGAPTPVQTSSVASIFSDAKSLMIIGGVVLGGVTLFLVANK